MERKRRLDPETLGIVLILAGPLFGPGAAISWGLYQVADEVGPMLERGDLLPLPPSEGPPIPRFIKYKPEVVARVKEMLS